MKNEYEATQDFNVITKFLHSTRYSNLIEVAGRVSRLRGALNVLDIGCGTCRAYEALDQSGLEFRYRGIEIREDFAELVRARHESRENFTISVGTVSNFLHSFDGYDLIIGLESFEHIPEPLVVRVIEAIAKSDVPYIYITVPNEVGPALLVKNFGSMLMGYSRHTEYSAIETIRAGFYQLNKVGRHGTGHKGFDWHWLAQTLRQHFTIIRNTRSPSEYIPLPFSPSVGFVCRRDHIKDDI